MSPPILSAEILFTEIYAIALTVLRKIILTSSTRGDKAAEKTKRREEKIRKLISMMESETVKIKEVFEKDLMKKEELMESEFYNKEQALLKKLQDIEQGKEEVLIFQHQLQL